MHFQCAIRSESGLVPLPNSGAALWQSRRQLGGAREIFHEVVAPNFRQRRLVVARASELGTVASATSNSGTSPGPPGSRLEAAVEALQTRLRRAVLAEQAEQQKQQQAAYSRASAQRLARDGLALLNLAAAPQGRQVARQACIADLLARCKPTVCGGLHACTHMR